MSDSLTSLDMPPVVTNDKQATIADSGTESDVIDLRGCTLVGAYIPSGFDGSTLAFKASQSEGGTFYDVYTFGTDLSYIVTASKYIAIDKEDFLGVQFLKLVVPSQTGEILIPLSTRPL